MSGRPSDLQAALDAVSAAAEGLQSVADACTTTFRTEMQRRATALAEAHRVLSAATEAAPIEPSAWMRRWAFDGVRVCKMRKADRPEGWHARPLTRHKLYDHDVPLGRLAALAPVGAGGGVDDLLAELGEGSYLAVVNKHFADLLYWVNRACEKGHYEDIEETWEAFDYRVPPSREQGKGK